MENLEKIGANAMLPNIMQEIENMSKLRAELEDSLMRLQEKISPILKPSIPKVDKENKISAGHESDLGMKLNANNDHIGSITRTVNDMLTRVEL